MRHGQIAADKLGRRADHRLRPFKMEVMVRRVRGDSRLCQRDYQY
jgi:hypothetical protein